MEKIIEFAQKIRNTELREKTVSMLRNPLPSHPDWNTGGMSLPDSPASTSVHHSYSGGLIEHLLSVASISLTAADVVEDVHGVDINRDELLTAALLHDVMKPITYSETENGYNMNDASRIMNHLLMATAEAYRRGFPIGVVHAIAAHHGQGSPVRPMTLEAMILHLADTMDADLNNKVVDSARRITSARLRDLEVGTDHLPKVFDQLSPFEILQSRQRDGRDAVKELIRDTLNIEKRG